MTKVTAMTFLKSSLDVKVTKGSPRTVLLRLHHKTSRSLAAQMTSLKKL